MTQHGKSFERTEEHHTVMWWALVFLVAGWMLMWGKCAPPPVHAPALPASVVR